LLPEGVQPLHTLLIVVRIVAAGRRTVAGNVNRILAATDAFAASVQADIAAKVSSNDLLGYRQDIQVNKLKRINLVSSQLKRILNSAVPDTTLLVTEISVKRTDDKPLRLMRHRKRTVPIAIAVTWPSPLVGVNKKIQNPLACLSLVTSIK